MALKLFPEVLDKLDIFILEVEELLIPKVYIWIFGPFVAQIWLFGRWNGTNYCTDYISASAMGMDLGIKHCADLCGMVSMQKIQRIQYENISSTEHIHRIIANIFR